MPIFENTITGQRYELLEGTRLPNFFKRVEKGDKPVQKIEVEDKTPDAEPVEVKAIKQSQKSSGKGAKNGKK